MGKASIGDKIEAKISDPETPLILRVISKAGKNMSYLKRFYFAFKLV